jgi:nucleoside-diphosphate-sugar epimerase
VNTLAIDAGQLRCTRLLVTGGTSGLGRAMAAALVTSGARVALTSRNRGRAQATAAELGGEAIGIELDVLDQASVQAGVAAAYDHLGGVDMLVANAGIGMRTVNPAFMTNPEGLLEPEIMGPPIVWLASDQADRVHNERIVATEFEDWLTHRHPPRASPS